jgi:hypothetical protein
MLKRFSFQHTGFFSKDAGLLTTSTLPFKELDSFNGVPFCFEEDTFSLTKCNFVGSRYSSQINMFNVMYADLLLVTNFGIHTHTPTNHTIPPRREPFFGTMHSTSLQKMPCPP